MGTENTESGLSASEQAYFDSKGTADIPDLATETEETATQTAEATETVEADSDPEVIEAEIDAAEADEGDKPAGEPKKVPLAALTKTRAEAKEERNKRIEAERKAAILEDRWNMLLAQQQPTDTQSQAQVEDIPDPDTDPQGAIRWATEQIRKQQAAQQEQAQQTEAQRKATQEWQETVKVVEADYNASVTEDPTIKSAHEYLLNSQGEEFMAMGLSREEAQQEISRIEAEHIKFAKAKGLKIGPYIKALAKARGFNGEAPKQEQKDPAKELAALEAAVDGSTSLSNAGGGAPATVNAEAVANMNEADFEKWLSKNGIAKFRKLAGG